MPQVPTQPTEAGRVFTCFDCGQFQRLPDLPLNARARCTRCSALIVHHKPDTLRRTLAWGLAALVMFVVAVSLPFMSIDLYGRSRVITLASGPFQLDQDGLWELGFAIFLFSIVAPAARILGIVAVIAGQYLRRPPAILHILLRWTEHLRVWSMVEVYMLGLFVAYTKLVDLASVQILAAGYALGALMLLQAMTETSFDREAVWQALEARGLVHQRRRVAGTLAALATQHPATAGLVGCHHCGFTTRGERVPCPRCGGRVHARKPRAIGRCWALLGAAAILYIPANLFPILTAVELGRGDPATILGGVRQLIQAGMFPLALLVFIASITVPAVKLIGLVIVLVTTGSGTRRYLMDRTRLFRVVEIIGRWSMIDMFMLSILVGLVRLGFVASVTPGYGALAFASVVVLTMLAAMAFDPRLMWDAAREGTR